MSEEPPRCPYCYGGSIMCASGEGNQRRYWAEKCNVCNGTGRLSDTMKQKFPPKEPQLDNDYFTRRLSKKK